MIEFLPTDRDAVVGIRVSGRLTDADYKDVLIPRLEQALAQGMPLRLVVEVDEDFAGWDMEAAWDDAAFGIGHRADFERLALVGAPRWLDWGARLTAFLMAGEVRTFPRGQAADAWAWAAG